jgi:hypothetical protein
MSTQPTSKGPWTHRALVWLFAVALSLLTYWLLGFIVNDIATWPGPDYRKIEEELLDPRLREEQRAIAALEEDLQRQVRQRESRQALLRDSTESSRQTMNQLLDIHRLSLEKNVEPTEAEQQALAEAEKRFLDNQKMYQDLNRQLVDLKNQQADLEVRRRNHEAELAEALVPVQEEYQRRFQWDQYLRAAAKLGVLLPLIVIVGALFLRLRRSIYAPMVYAVGVALAARVIMVMHDAFPRPYFKYILIGVALLIVARILVYLLTMIGRPSADYLVRQYREAYERFFCPVCDYPIRRGPLKFVFWSRRTIKHLHFPPQTPPPADEPYTCPACGTLLFEKCAVCGNVRHSLLPICSHCGSAKDVAAAPAKN